MVLELQRLSNWPLLVVGIICLFGLYFDPKVNLKNAVKLRSYRGLIYTRLFFIHVL